MFGKRRKLKEDIEFMDKVTTRQMAEVADRRKTLANLRKEARELRRKAKGRGKHRRQFAQAIRVKKKGK